MSQTSLIVAPLTGTVGAEVLDADADRFAIRAARGVATVLAVVALVACGSSSSTATRTTNSTSEPATTSTTRGLTGRATQWRDVTAEWKARAPGAFAKGPDAVAEDLAAAWRGADTSTVGKIDVVSVRTGEPLVVVVRETGGANDGIVGTDVEITLEGGDEGWVVSAARAQDTCVEVAEAAPTHCV